MRKFLIGALALLLSLPALAQSVVQSGTITPNHAAAWSSSGVIKDAGTSALGKLTTLGITALGGTPFCVSNGTGAGATAYSQFCMGLDTSNAYFQINGFNGASALGFVININGTPIALGTGDVTGPSSSISNNLVSFNGTSGKVIKDTGIAASSVPSLSGTNTWTGANTFSAALNATGTGSVTLTPTSTGTVTINPNTAGSLDNVAIGGSTPKAGAFTTISASGTQTFTGAATFNGGLTASGSNVSDVFSPTGSGTVTINPATAGTMNNMVIGGSTPLAGAFTTLSTTSTATVGGAATFSTTQTTTGTATFNGALTASPAGANVTLSPSTTGTVTIAPNTAGTLDNMVIGNSTPLAGHFTTLSTTGVSTLSAGLVGAPSINFGDNTTGFYRSASGRVAVTAAGTLQGYWSGAGLTMSNTLTLADSAAWSAAGLNMAGSYSTSSTTPFSLTPSMTYSSIADNIIGVYLAPNLIPAGATAGTMSGVFADTNVGTSSVDMSAGRALTVRLSTAVGYTGTMTNGYGININGPGVSGTKAITFYRSIQTDAIANGNGITSGTATNAGVNVGSQTAGAGSGGTVTNSGIILGVPSGAGAGTTTNYGLNITGNGGSGGGGTTTNYAIYSDSTAASLITGALTVSGAATLSNASIVTTNLATDATHTTRTVCQDTTSKALYFGSGSAGVCLGTSSLRFKRPDTVRVLSHGLDQVLDLKPINYFYKNGYGDDGARLQYGFLAEDVVRVIPKLVGFDKDDKPNSVDMVGMIPVLVSAIQDLQKEVSDLKAQIAANDNGVAPASRRAAR